MAAIRPPLCDSTYLPIFSIFQNAHPKLWVPESTSKMRVLTKQNKEFRSSMHRQFRTAHEGHKPHAGLDPSRASTGVVWTTERAYEHGYLEDPSSWANLGQGAPEVDDDIEGCFARPTHIDITMTGREYGPTAGIKPLRDAVANLYNEHHRKDKVSKYTWENVCIVPGGRAGLIRIAAVLGKPLFEI